MTENRNKDTFQALLATMLAEFLDELPDRCDKLDELVLSLEKSPDDRETFNELYRRVHSLKGSGGTHGLNMITVLCHQLENRLADAQSGSSFGAGFVSAALAYVDLIRQVTHQAHRATPDYSGIETGLAMLHERALKSRKAGLIAESSATMAGFYCHTLASMPLQLTVVDNGLTALERLLREPFDFVIVGRELKELNGIALMAAVRASMTRNSRIPALLVTSQRNAISDSAGFDAVIARDQSQVANLDAELRRLLGI